MILRQKNQGCLSWKKDQKKRKRRYWKKKNHLFRRKLSLSIVQTVWFQDLEEIAAAEEEQELQNEEGKRG